MQKVIVADTSCLILFTKIGEFELLEKIFGKIIISDSVYKEFNRPVPAWIEILTPATKIHLGLSGFLDLGEATSIGLALELNNTLLIIDESKGRSIAKKFGVKVTGSLGLLVVAKKKGIIKSVKPLIEKIKKTNFRLSDDLIQKILFYADET